MATFCIVLFVCSVSWLFLFGCQYQCKWLTGKTHLRNDLWSVDGDVEPYSLTHCILGTYLFLIHHCVNHLNCCHIQEALNMVIPAMQLAGKIPDVHVQLWASALLKGASHSTCAVSDRCCIWIKNTENTKKIHFTARCEYCLFSLQCFWYCLMVIFADEPMSLWLYLFLTLHF